MNNHSVELRRKIDLVVHEVKALRSTGPRFRILHRLRIPGTNCLPGEEVAAAYLISLGRAFFLRLALSQLLLFDYLAKHLHLPQTAAQIVAGLRSDCFYSEHGRNASTGKLLIRRFSPVSIKEYVRRLRGGIGLALADANLSIDPASVLVAESTTTNQVTYVLRATVEWHHLDLGC